MCVQDTGHPACFPTAKLQTREARRSLWATAGFVTKVLSEHSHTHWFVCHSWWPPCHHSRGAVTDRLAQKAKITYFRVYRKSWLTPALKCDFCRLKDT